MPPSVDPTLAGRVARAPGMLEPGSLVGEYRIERLLGKGGMGEVYAAVHPVIAKRAAIKVLRAELSSDPSTIERFVLEARAVNEIQHPSIIDIFAFGTLEDGRHYFVMELLRGVSLKDRIASGPVPLHEAREILLAIADALAASHAIGIVHRDLKPDNVFLVEVRTSSTVKLLDFGIAKLVQSDRKLDQTGTGIFIGTPAYASPEQTRGDKVDHRSDLYSFGVVAFEMLTGRVPFAGGSVAAIAAQHLYEPAPSIAKLAPELPPQIAELVQGLLAKDPAERPTHDQIRARLQAPTALAVEPPRPQRRLRGIAAASIACVVASAAGLAILLATREPSSSAISAPPGDAATFDGAPAAGADTAVEPPPQPADAAVSQEPASDAAVERAPATKPDKRRRKRANRRRNTPSDDPDGLL